MTDKEKIYCLQRHFAALYRQHKCEEKADFVEPCEDCKIIEKCRCEWMNLLDDFAEDIIVSPGCSVSQEYRGIGIKCPPECIDYDRHKRYLSSCKLHDQTP